MQKRQIKESKQNTTKIIKSQMKTAREKGKETTKQSENSEQNGNNQSSPSNLK